MHKSPDNLRRLVCVTDHSSNMIVWIVRTHPTFSLHEVCGSCEKRTSAHPRQSNSRRSSVGILSSLAKRKIGSAFCFGGRYCLKKNKIYRPLKHKSSCSENKDERVLVKTGDQRWRIRTCTASATLRPWLDLRGHTTDHSHPQA